MRIFAIDLGDKRTGLALADRITRIASPAGLIEIPIEREAGESLLGEICRRYQSQTGGSSPASRVEIVLGLPLNMDQSEGPRALLVRRFAQRLANRARCAVVLVDERRTSIAADQRMAQSGLTHKQKKRRRDAIAAATIAQSYLDEPDVEIDRIEPIEPK